MSAGTLICRTGVERRRLEDVRLRLGIVPAVIVAMYLAAWVSGVSAYGWLPLLPLVLAASLSAVMCARLKHYARPEYPIAGVWLLSELATAAAISLAHGPHASLLAIMAVPTVLILVIFPARTALVVVAITEALTISAALGFDSAEVARMPPLLILPFVLIVILACILSTARNLDVSARRTAVVDQLTGLLNRGAMAPRVAELEHQASMTGEQVAVIAIDVDHFKAINDRHGHAVGDGVLRGVARRLSACAEQNEPIYRCGGEEFVVLLPGVGTTHARSVAESLRHAIASEPVSDIAVTISLGVAVSLTGHGFDFKAVFACADEALYDAKRGGRNRVCVGSAGETSATPVRLTPRRAAAPLTGRDGGDQPRVGRRTRRDLSLVSEEPVLPARTTAAGHGDGVASINWLVRDSLERDHLIDLTGRLNGIFMICGVIAFVAGVAAGPWLGWAPLGPPAAGAIIFRLVHQRVGTMRRPEYWILLSYLLLQLSIVLGFALERGAPLFALPMLLIMLPGACATFPKRGVFVVATFTALIITGVAVDLHAHQIASDPAVLALPLALLGTLTLVGSTVGQSAVGYRGASVVDQLTGMLNRHALNASVAAMEVGPKLRASQTAVIIGDVDHFKEVNDRHGHAAGDAVLVEVAYRMRKSIRAFDSAFRIGGDEFAILLPGVGLQQALTVAEHLRLTLCDAPASGVAITMSFGVFATTAGEQFQYETAFASADAALYAAKQRGRERVCANEVNVPELAAAVA